jgi:hypothetical protein
VGFWYKKAGPVATVSLEPAQFAISAYRHSNTAGTPSNTTVGVNVAVNAGTSIKVELTADAEADAKMDVGLSLS